MGTPDALLPLSVYELAYLAGGPDRVVDTALVVLVESGRVRVHAPGQLAVVFASRHDPVEAALLDAIGTHGHRSVDTIRWRLSGDERLLDLRRSLTAAGLLRRRVLGPRGTDRRAWSTTGAGRRALRRAREDRSTAPALDGGSALAVALGGRRAMPSAERRAEIFGRPRPPLPPDSGMHRRIREVRWRDPMEAAYRSQQTTIGGAGAFGFIEGGAGDGGGF